MPSRSEKCSKLHSSAWGNLTITLTFFRKTVVKWAQQNCSQLEFKALSQNLGHEHAMTTYNAYGDLSVDEQFQVIAKIGAAHAELANVPMDAILQEVARRTSK